MKKLHRILIVAAVFASGLALMPYFAFPTKAVHWEAFAEAYEVAFRVFVPLIMR